jgi:hypothetical protein
MKIKYLQNQLVMKDIIFDFSTIAHIHNYTLPPKPPSPPPNSNQQKPNHHPWQDNINAAQDQFVIQDRSFALPTTVQAHTHTSSLSSRTQMPNRRSSAIMTKSSSQCWINEPQKDNCAPSAIWGRTGTAADSAGGRNE